MTDRLLTLHDLTEPARARRRPELFHLRVLERDVRERIDRLDARVDRLLQFTGVPSTEDIAEIDVLCAAIAEAQELYDEVGIEAARHAARTHERRTRPRRWA